MRSIFCELESCHLHNQRIGILDPVNRRAFVFEYLGRVPATDKNSELAGGKQRVAPRGPFKPRFLLGQIAHEFLAFFFSVTFQDTPIPREVIRFHADSAFPLGTGSPHVVWGYLETLRR